ncbi:NAD(P)H-dependent oxidoreductase [Microbispora sp. NPDC046933]|uniref:NADPH-dependent FMN reductase n=1 Tax=Microbispora sp. NPDC046933 TaxID=3155618 RepID=UPI0033E3E5E4
MIKVGVIIGSTRPGRNGAAVARWVHDLAVKRGDADYELVDLEDYALPHLDEPLPAAAGQYEHAHTRRWSEAVAALDAFVFVTPEYNRSTSGALKTAIDFLYAEWANKAAGFVGYGVDGGARAIEHLRQILATAGVAGVAPQVTLSIRDDFENFSDFRPAARHEDSVRLMLDQVVSWAEALRTVRV